MGFAVIIPGVDFSDVNLGQVTLVGDIPLESLAITGDSAVLNSATFAASYTPSNTTERGVAWSVVSGSAYATINSSTGELTALPGANASSVTIRVTSTDKPSIYAEKTITVTSTSWYTQKGGLVGDNVARIDTLYMINANTKIETDYRIDSLPAVTGTAQYRRVWMAYENDNLPVSRHLILVQNGTPKQMVQFGANSTGGMNGMLYYFHNLPPVGERFQETVSTDGYTSTETGYYFVRDNQQYSWPRVSVLTALCEMTLFRQKFSENGVLVKDFVPAILNTNITADMASDNQAHSTGECGLVDRVGNIFYPNFVSGGTYTVID